MSSDNLAETDLDRLLMVQPPSIRNDLQTALLTQTTSVIRRRRATRRLLFTAACAACYVAGLGTMLALPQQPRLETQSIAQSEQPAPKFTSADTSLPSDPPVSVIEPPTTPPERPAPPPMLPARKLSQFESLRRLGDLYLLERGDPEGAIRCYRMALRYAQPEELEMEAETGTWLYQAIRLDLQKGQS